MTDPLSTDEAEKLAKQRFFTLSFLRLSGAALTIFGLLIYAGRIDFLAGEGSTQLGIILILAGLVEFFWIPIALARHWRTPDA